MSTSTKKKFYFRSTEELDGTPEFESFLHREFPQAASEFPEGMSRRRWLQLMGASLALGGVVGCRFENETIAPFALRPQNRVPGTTKDFATSIEWCGEVQPLLVSCYDGRPIYVKGNPDHPLSGGAAGARVQASLLHLYDPDRSRGVAKISGDEVTESSWEDFFKATETALADPTGFAILAESSASPSLNRLRKKLTEKYSGAKWYNYSSISNDNRRSGMKMAFGKAVLPQHELDKAKVIVCLDADPLCEDSTSEKNQKVGVRAVMSMNCLSILNME